MENTDHFLGLAVDVAKEAGRLLRVADEDLRVINLEDAKDVKLEADVRSEALIRERLSTASTYPVIGEEEGGDTGLLSGGEPYWIVDPLDGTYNYLRRLPETCVSLGMFCGRDPVLGVIYDFNRDETFAATVDGELFVNGAVERPVWADAMANAAIACGFPATGDYTDEGIRRFIGYVQKFKKVRLLGSAALSLAYVACGRLDSYYESGVRLWDFAAGAALVKAAGGTCRFTAIDEDALTYCVSAAGRENLLVT